MASISKTEVQEGMQKPRTFAKLQSGTTIKNSTQVFQNWGHKRAITSTQMHKQECTYATYTYIYIFLDKS